MDNVGFRREVAAWLESGRFQGPLAEWTAKAWEKRSRPVRPLALPSGVAVVGVGGATLGGAGKTPVVMQLASELSARGARVAVVASSYRARPPMAVRVLSHHHVARIGDEALLMCRALPEVPVYVGQNRERALALAARGADFVIVDGLLQAAPERLALSILVLDGAAPWGAGACPPRGDLRARRDRLLRACDALLVDGSLDQLRDVALPVTRYSFTRRLVAVELPGGERVSMDALGGKRLGLVTTMARPERLRQRLAKLGIEIVCFRAGADHGRLSARRRTTPDIDAWLATAKCREQLGQVFENIPVWVLIEAVSLPEQLVESALDKGVIATQRAVLESAPCSPDR